AEQASAGLARARTEAAEDREELSALMGLSGEASTSWRIRPRLPDLPYEDVASDDLETRAVSQRLDLAAAQQRVYRLLLARDLTRRSRFLPMAGLGVPADPQLDHRASSARPPPHLPLPT